MFNGVQANLKIGELPGWRVALCKPANEITTMADFDLPGIAQDSHLLIGAKKPGEDELLVAAIGRRDIISSRGWDRHHNNVYWGFNDRFFCFASSPLGPVCGHPLAPSVMGNDMCVWSLESNIVVGTNFEKLIMVPIGG